jgi:Ni/Co efflux regulator RcnB
VIGEQDLQEDFSRAMEDRYLQRYGARPARSYEWIARALSYVLIAALLLVPIWTLIAG